MLQVQRFLDRATSAAECPVDYFLPRTGKLRRVRAMDSGELRLIRTELELLRRIQRHLRRQAPAVGSDRLGASAAHPSTEQRAEYADIVRCASHPLISEMIHEFDREFSHVREEILMSVVNEEAEAIAQSAIESRVAPSDPPSQPTPASAASEGVEIGAAEASVRESEGESANSDPAEVVDSPSAPPHESQGATPAHDAEEGQVIGAEEALADLDELADSLVEAEAALGEVLDELPPDPTVGASALEDASAEPAPEERATTPSGEPKQDAESASTTPGATPDGPPAITATTPSEELCADSRHDHSLEPVCSERDASALVQDQPSGGSPGESSDAEPTPKRSADDQPGGAHDESVVSDPPAAEPDPAAPGADETPRDDVSEEQELPDPDSKEETKARAYDAEWAAGAVQEIDAGIRKLAELLSGDVRAQWEQASESLAEITRTRAGAEESVGEAQSLLVELRALRDEAKAATAELNAMRDEARAYREAARLAKTRAETAADIAEKLTDQIRNEQSACPS